VEVPSSLSESLGNAHSMISGKSPAILLKGERGLYSESKGGMGYIIIHFSTLLGSNCPLASPKRRPWSLYSIKKRKKCLVEKKTKCLLRRSLL